MNAQEIEFFLALGQIAMAIVTFAALVLVLRQLVGGGLNAFHVLTLKMFAVSGFETAFCALAPFIFEFAGLGRDIIWRLACALLITIVVITNTWYFRARRRAAPSRVHNRGTWISLAAHILAVSVMSGQVFGVISASSSAPLAFGLVTCLVPMVAGFLTTLQDFLEIGD